MQRKLGAVCPSVEPESRLLGASAPGERHLLADLNLQQIEKPSGSSRKKASERAPSSPQAYSGDGDYANTVCAWWGSDQTMLPLPLRMGLLSPVWEGGR